MLLGCVKISLMESLLLNHFMSDYSDNLRQVCINWVKYVYLKDEYNSVYTRALYDLVNNSNSYPQYMQFVFFMVMLCAILTWITKLSIKN
jgi:hypothetical protein